MHILNKIRANKKGGNRLKGHFFFLFFLTWLLGCNSGKELSEIMLVDKSGETFPAKALFGQAPVVFFFLSPDCPLCQLQSVEIAKIKKEFSEKGILFFGIFPGKFYTPEEALFFRSRYLPELEVFFDTELKFTLYCSATITPEVFLFTSGGMVFYRGAIDDSAVAPGKTRSQVTKPWLRQALTAILENRSFEPKQTRAIGCFIEF